MATLKELRDERLRKLEEIKNLGVNPYPATAKRTNKASEIIEKFGELEGQTVTLAGRLINTRKFGKIAFFVLKDASGQIQLFLKHDTVAQLDATNSRLGFEQINLLDPGDFIEVTGPVIKTQTDEISVEVHELRLLTKSLRPLPTEQEGFTNKEERLRRRYIDTSVNRDVYERFIRRSEFWRATRDFLNQQNFIEINTPVLEHTTGGADATPFVTYMDAIDQDFYLRISHELPLKRLIGGGYEKVYDIGPRFRNENYSDEHLPEHVAMEWYWAYADWQSGMKLTQELFRYVMKEVYKRLDFKIRGFDVDLSKDWELIDYAEIIKKHFGLNVFSCTLDEVKQQLAQHNLEVEKTENKARGIDKLWKSLRSTIGGPAFLVNTPTFISPLSKANPTNPAMVDRFQPIIAGSELGNGWSELNDPIDQLNRFLEQQAMRDAGDDEAQMLDIDYVEMLEYGMPPTCGYGHSERVFWIFEDVPAREGVVFPQLRREVDEVTKNIYPDINWHKQTAKRRTNTLDPSSEKASEENRLAYQLVVILNKQIETGRVINAAAHAVSGFIGTLPNPTQLNYLEYQDKSGEFEAIISHHPTIILQAADSKELLKAYRKAQAAHLPSNVFIQTMTIGSSQEELKILENKTIEELDFWGLVLFGKTEDVQKITKDFQLWK